MNDISNIYDSIDPEELEDIEYLEILSFEEIIDDNPDFQAFTKEEIYDELYDFFKNSNKASNLVSLFFKKNKLDYNNYVFIADASKINNDECDGYEDEDQLKYVKEFLNNFKNKSRLQFSLAQKEKDKLFFALDYDVNSKKLRYIPDTKTNIEIQDIKNNMKANYFLYETDDINIPIIGIYYKKPSYIKEDYLSDKISSSPEIKNMNFVKTDNFESIDDVIKKVNVSVNDLLDDINGDELNYTTINNILLKYNTSFNDISLNDYDIIYEHVKKLIDDTKEQKINYKKPKIKSIEFKNDKVLFYDKIDKIMNLIDTQNNNIEEAINNLQDEKININFSGLIYNNSSDILNSVQNNDVTIETIIQNISDHQKIFVIDNCITTLNKIQSTDIEESKKLLEDFKVKFNIFKKKYNDIYPLRFLDFYSDIQEIKQGNDYTDYDGIPTVYLNVQNFEGMGDTNEIYETGFVTNVSSTSFDKVLLSSRYKNANGFKEVLKIVLNLLEKIQIKSALSINYEMLSEELYKHFSGVPAKIDILNKILHKNKLSFSKDIIDNVINITPYIAINLYPSDDISPFLKECNQEYVEILFDMLYTGLSWWCIQILEEHINEFLIFDENKIQIEYIDKWSLSGVPIDNTAKDGVLVYISEIANDVLEDENSYTVPKNILKSTMKIIEDKYKSDLETIRNNNKIIEKKNKGRETFKILKHHMKDSNVDKLLNSYINALLYMPGYKFKKIHKFLLGCCLQKIGSDFVTDSDLIAINRTDLKDMKIFYSKNRKTINIYKKMFYIQKDIQKNEKEIFHKTNLKMYDNHDYDIMNWVDSIDSSLFPIEIIETIRNKGVKELENYSFNYMNLFLKTTRNRKNKDIIKDIHDINHINILRNIILTLRSYIAVDSEENTLLNNSCMVISNIIKKIHTLDSMYNDINKKDIIIIKNYILFRSICLPFNPDIQSNGMLVSTSKVSSEFPMEITQLVYKNIVKYIESIKMPSYDDNIKYMNSIREKNKNKILDEMNAMSKEERAIYDDIKKTGLDMKKIMIEENINNKTDDVDDENDYDIEEEDGYDDDSLDNNNYGFIYS